MSSFRFAVAAAAIFALAAVSASAQPIISAKSGVIAGVEGKVFLDNNAVESSVTHFPDIKENSVLRTEDGRAEVLLPPGYVLRLGENGSFKMLTSRLIDTRVELLAGSAVVEVDENSPDTNVTVALGASTVRLAKTGAYRFDSNPPRLKVFHGSAMVQMGDQNIIVSTGKMLSLAGGTAQVEKFDVEDTDSLDHWSRRRAESMALANVSAAKYVNDNYGRMGTNSWGYNPYFGMYTYIPMNGRSCNPYYSNCYFSPGVAYQAYFAPQAVYNNSGFGANNAGFNPGYTQMQGTSTGTSSITSAAAPSSSPAMSSTSTTASSAASSSAGHGSAASGGHGK